MDRKLVRGCWEFEQMEGNYRRLVKKWGSEMEELLLEVVDLESRLRYERPLDEFGLMTTVNSVIRPRMGGRWA